MLSPITGKPMIATHKLSTATYRGVKVEFIWHYWQDADYDEQFTTGEQDDLNQELVKEAYEKAIKGHS